MSKIGAKVKRHHDKIQRAKLIQWLEAVDQQRATSAEVERQQVQDLTSSIDREMLQTMAKASEDIKQETQSKILASISSPTAIRLKYLAYTGLFFIVLWILAILVASFQ